MKYESIECRDWVTSMQDLVPEIKPFCSVNLYDESGNLFDSQALSQQEIDELLEYYNNTGLVPDKYKEVAEPTGCRHEWKLYQGFTDTYNYCSKCNVKRS